MKNKLMIYRSKSGRNDQKSEDEEEEEEENGGGQMIMVGLKLDQQSRELLTWVLVKVAQPGDQVIALHILSNSEVVGVGHNSQSSLFSLVKAFDSVLAVYEGFCNLKQVDLKLKICRGSSIRKVLVREAKSYVATKVIVGTATKFHGIGSSTSVAKYCARKLSRECCILAVNNGKVLFQRDSVTLPKNGSRGDDRVHQNFLFEFRRSLSKKCNLFSVNSVGSTESAYPWSTMKQNCSVCEPNSHILGKSISSRLVEESSDYGSVENSMALVPVRIQELPELRPGWPLLRRSILGSRQPMQRPRVKEISVVQWAMQLPNRLSSSNVYPHHRKTSSYDWKTNHSYGLNGDTSAIVLVGKDLSSCPSSFYDATKSIPRELESLHNNFSSGCRLFSYQELRTATSNFMPENLIGKGGNSLVYKGCLPDGRELAVKILNQSEHAVKEFVLEINIITALHHKNVIHLVGFCFEDHQLLLAYEFLSRGSLEENLHGFRDKIPLGWGARYKVALGVSEALDYLHNSSQAVIHGDVKSSNILLSDGFEPQLSDFGLAKWTSTSASHITCTDVAGTFGYLAPEYFVYGKVDDKIDVYSFGVVLLELLSGRKPIDTLYPRGQESLVMWAKLILDGGKIVELLDPKLGDNYDHDQLEWMVLAATLCIRREPRSRPRMNLVMKLLHGDADVIRLSRLQVSAAEQGLDEEAFPNFNIQSHLDLALLDIEDDALSVSTIEQGLSCEEYLQGRRTRSSSYG